MATIETATGNIFTARVEALVNPVNCVGVMGKGLALAFKKAFPPMFEDYRKACTAGELEPGRARLLRLPRRQPVGRGQQHGGVRLPAARGGDDH